MKYNYLTYRIDLESPALLPSGEGDANHIMTLPYVPGSAIRGAVASACNGATDLIKKLVLCDHIQYLNAYPAHGSIRALPVPVSIRKKKGTDDIGQTMELVNGIQTEDQLVPLSTPFYARQGTNNFLLQPSISSHVHHQRSRAMGRATQNEGAIFSYDSLDPGQSFAGIVVVAGLNDAEIAARVDAVKDAMGDTLFVGRSRRAEYGGTVKLTWLPQKGKEVSAFASLEAEDISDGKELRVLLLSPYIGRDPNTGQPSPAALDQELRSLGLVPSEYFWTFSTASGFNRKWQLPLPHVHTVAGGSVVVCKTDGAKKEVLESAVHCGLGERRIEGYGRVLFLKKDDPIGQFSVATKPTAPRPTSPPPDALLQAQGRLLRKHIEARIADRAPVIAQGATFIPTASLIGRIRTTLRGLDAPALTTGMQTWFDKLKEPAQKQLRKCRVEGVNLRVWLEKTANEKLESNLEFDVAAQKRNLTTEADARAQLDAIRDELFRAWMDAVMAALARRKKGD